MEPLTVTSLATVLGGLWGGATGEAGAQAIRALLKLLRRTRHPDEDAELAEIEHSIENRNVEDTGVVAEYLAKAAKTDADFDRALRAWLDEATLVIANASVSNTVGTVHGNVIQAGVINTDSITQ